MKTSTLFYLTLLLLTAGDCPGSAPRAYAQARDSGRTRTAGAAARSTIRGRVVYADTGNPVRRAQVTMMNAGTGERLGGAVTDVKGQFSFRSVPAGRYSLAAAAPSLADPSVLPPSDAAADLLDFAEGRNGLAEVEVDGASEAGVVIRARRGGAITGRVTSEDGEPAAGARLRLFRLRQGQLARLASTWQPPSREKKHLETDSRGVYRVGGLPAGDYIVRASEGDLGAGGAGEEGETYGDGSLVVSYFPSAGSVKDAVPVKVYEGRDTEGVDIRIPDRPTRRLAGTVTLKRGGGPVAWAEVMIDRKDEGRFPRRGFAEEAAKTDADGRWSYWSASPPRLRRGINRATRVAPAGQYVSLRSRGGRAARSSGRLRPGGRYYRRPQSRRGGRGERGRVRPQPGARPRNPPAALKAVS